MTRHQNCLAAALGWVALAASPVAASPRIYEPGGDTWRTAHERPVCDDFCQKAEVDSEAEHRACIDSCLDELAELHREHEDDIGWLPTIDRRRGGSNYFMLNLGGEDEGGWVHFRINIESDLVRLEKWPGGYWYLTFIMRMSSFWDLFETTPGARSSPFVENNYAPGGELTWFPTERMWSGSPLSLRLGFQHESNGLGYHPSNGDDELLSRSWNRAYGGLDYRTRWNADSESTIRATTWLPVASDDVMQWENADPDDADKKIEDFRGYWSTALIHRQRFHSWLDFTLSAEARARLLILELRWHTRKARASDLFSVEPTTGNGARFDLISRCHFGYAERLITANETRYHCYVGLGL